jgi:hypothetical protein
MGNLLTISELMKRSHRNTRCCGSGKHSVQLMRVARLSVYEVEQSRCLISRLGEIHQDHSRKGAKMLHSQQLKESLLATTKNRITGRAVKFCRRQPAQRFLLSSWVWCMRYSVPMRGRHLFSGWLAARQDAQKGRPLRLSLQTRMQNSCEIRFTIHGY